MRGDGCPHSGQTGTNDENIIGREGWHDS